ncbi:chromosome partitioning protein Soj [Xenorhabdus miraniensis]|uniref:Chromosome partitioning protein Soj n=1 Tax=Xenorhabdus miraniensis TaxID=351674 RepID=A0A2D0JK94_9GAMM|nr:chromosome partitioning protein Soj [Xenorhabdus miraniensis]
MLTRLRPFENYGIRLPLIQILANSIEGTNLDRDTLNELTGIIGQQRYDTSALGGRKIYQLLRTRIDLLDIYKLGHVRAQPVHRLEYKTVRKSPAAAQTMHSLACELFPEWAAKFDAVLVSQPTGDAQ